jgi:GAF domain-containing protein
VHVQVVDGMLLQLPSLRTTSSPHSHVTTPQHSAPQPTQLVVMQGIGNIAGTATDIPVGSVIMTAAPMQVHIAVRHPACLPLRPAVTSPSIASCIVCALHKRAVLCPLQGQQPFVAQQPQAGLVMEQQQPPPQQQQHIVTHMVSLPSTSMAALQQQQQQQQQQHHHQQQQQLPASAFQQVPRSPSAAEAFSVCCR